MEVDVRNEKITVKSRFTGYKYDVLKIKIINNEVTQYKIRNQGELEWWNTSRFYSMHKPMECCPCYPCCKLINER